MEMEMAMRKRREEREKRVKNEVVAGALFAVMSLSTAARLLQHNNNIQHSIEL